MSEKPPLLAPRITHFSMIDGAMMRVVKAAAQYEAARYTVGEGHARDRVVKAAIELKETFEKLAKRINEEYAAEQAIKEKAKPE